MKNGVESIRERMDWKIESILAEKDDEIRTARIKVLNSQEMEVLEERLDEMNGEIEEGTSNFQMGNGGQKKMTAEEMLEQGVRPEDSLKTLSVDEFVDIARRFIIDRYKHEVLDERPEKKH